MAGRGRHATLPAWMADPSFASNNAPIIPSLTDGPIDESVSQASRFPSAGFSRPTSIADSVRKLLQLKPSAPSAMGRGRDMTLPARIIDSSTFNERGLLPQPLRMDAGI